MQVTDVQEHDTCSISKLAVAKFLAASQLQDKTKVEVEEAMRGQFP